MNKRTAILFCVLASMFTLSSCTIDSAYGQSMPLTVNVIIHSPGAYLSDWQTHPEALQIQITNRTPQTYLANAVVELTINGNLVARSKQGHPPPVSIMPGANTLNGRDFISLNDLDFFGAYRSQTEQTGMLPPGTFNICIKLYNTTDNQLLAQEKCGTIQITPYSPPRLLLPMDGTSILPNSRPLFKWQGVTPQPTSPVTYIFSLCEVLPGQTNMIEAFRSNQPIVTKEVVMQTLLLLPPEIPSLDSTKKYVWDVQAINSETRQPVGLPDGYAEPFVFTVSSRPTFPNLDSNGVVSDVGNGSGAGSGSNDGTGQFRNRDASPCGACTPVMLTDSSVASNNIAVGDTLRIGNFNMVVGTVTAGSSEGAAGTGSIRIPWLFTDVSVDFRNLRLTTAHEMISGDVTSSKASDAPSFPSQTPGSSALSGSWTKSVVASLDGYIHANGKIMSAASLFGTPITTPLGISNAAGYSVCISEIRFTKDNGVLTAIASIPIPSYDDTIAFGVTNLPFCPKGLSHKATLELLQDFTLHGTSNSANTFKVILKRGTLDRDGCYIAWSCDGFDSLAVDLDVQFPRTWLTPFPDNDPSKQVIASFSAKMTGWKNWMFHGHLDPCIIVGTNGFAMNIPNIVLDLSDDENFPGMVFPPNYNGTTGPDFKGFYADTIALMMPDGWHRFDSPSRTPVFAAEHLIIAKTGLTGDFVGTNIVTFPNADVARMSASLDTVRISLVNTSLTQAYVTGKITLPITDPDDQNAIDYKALFDIAQKRFDFTVHPDKDLHTNLFAGAKLTLNSTSIIAITLSKTEKKFSLTLNGSVGWSDQEIQVPGTSKKMKITFDPKFEGLSISYDDMVKPRKLVFNKGTWSFASPQSKLSSFPVSISHLAVESQPTTGTEMCAAALNFDLSVNLADGMIGGTGSFKLIGAIDKSTADDAKFSFKPKFKDFQIGSIYVHANLSAVDISGSLVFYNNDTKWGDGFYATISATFKSLQLQLSANARFGSVSNFRYWYVEAKAILPSPGIPFMEGYAFYGASVAAWSHINCDMTGATPKATDAPSKSPSSGAVMTPNKNIFLGFKIVGVLGTTPDPSKMNADVGVSAQFSSSGGILNLGFSGQIWLMAKFTDRSDAPVKGSIFVSYDFPNKIFDLNASITVNRAPITGSGTLKININGTTGKWYVKIGDPTNRCYLSVNLMGSSLTSSSYFMFGNNINPPSGFMAVTQAGLNRAGCGVNSSVLTSATTAAKSGTGLATGFQIGIARSGSIDLGVASIAWSANAGAEANLSLIRHDGTFCSGNTGYNHWYLRGSLAVYGGVSVKLHAYPWTIPSFKVYHPCCGKPWKSCFYDWSCYSTTPAVCLHCCGSGCDYTLAELNIGAYLEGGFPHPDWVVGSIAGNYNVLGGLIHGSFSANFSVGTPCRP